MAALGEAGYSQEQAELEPLKNSVVSLEEKNAIGSLTWDSSPGAT